MTAKDNRNPEYSVIITVYNKERHVGQAIESVLRQTYRDFELIVIDDGSSDGSGDIIRSFSDERMRYVHQKNSGLPAAARNRGMDMALGRYIALLDGDDHWHEDKLRRCKDALDKMPKVNLVCHNVAFVYRGKILKTTRFGPYVDWMHDKLLFEGNCLGPSAVVIRREVFFDQRLRFNEDRSLFALEDYEYWLRLSLKNRFFFMPDTLGYYTATDCGAFSRDTEGNAVNMLRLLDAHFSGLDSIDRETQKMIGRRRASVMCGAGRMYNHLRRFEDSRRWYLKALKEDRFSYKAYIGLMMAMARFSLIYR